MNDADVVSFLRQLVAEIPWGQNLLIPNKLTDPAARLWHLQATARKGKWMTSEWGQSNRFEGNTMGFELALSYLPRKMRVNPAAVTEQANM